MSQTCISGFGSQSPKSGLGLISLQRDFLVKVKTQIGVNSLGWSE